MRINADWIRAEGLQSVMGLLTVAGHQAFLVGGCVRNALISQPVADIDIATDAVPERVVALAEQAGHKVVPTGIDHGTVTVIAGGEVHEVTTFRRDVATDGRRATVAYATDLADDAARRDFTMNALYADASGQIYDPLGGLPDLLARRVRFVGDAAARIKEDYLRILRFFRFHAWYGDPGRGIDAEALAACAEHANGISRLSCERVGHEMRKLLAAPDPAPSVAAMHSAGILQQVLPEPTRAGWRLWFILKPGWHRTGCAVLRFWVAMGRHKRCGCRDKKRGVWTLCQKAYPARPAPGKSPIGLARRRPAISCCCAQPCWKPPLNPAGRRP